MDSDAFTLIKNEKQENMTDEQNVQNEDSTEQEKTLLQNENASLTSNLEKKNEIESSEAQQVLKKELIEISNENPQLGEDSQPFKKLDALYFLGVNSLSLNIFSSLCNLNLINLSLSLMIVNLITYIILYRLNKIKEFSSKSSKKTEELYLIIKQETNKEKILLGVGVLIISTILVLSISNCISIHQMDNKIYYSNLINQQEQNTISQLQRLVQQIEYRTLQANQNEYQLKIQATQQNQQQNLLQQRMNSLKKSIEQQFNEINQLNNHHLLLQKINNQPQSTQQNQKQQTKVHQQTQTDQQVKRSLQPLQQLINNIFSFNQSNQKVQKGFSPLIKFRVINNH